MSSERFDLAGKRVWVAGHRGMVGSAIVRRLASEDCAILAADSRTLDLRDQAQTNAWVAANRPQVAFIAAAHVGGIQANNTQPAQFLYDNLAIAANTIEASRQSGVEKLVFLGSSCIYPKFAAQPITEAALLTGSLEPTNEWYAIAKIAGIKLCQSYRRQYDCDFISAMPSNLYGVGDNFDLANSHVLPALIRKAHEAKLAGAATFTVWGSGTPRREFLFADDCADAVVFLAKRYSDEEHVNVGSGSDVTIAELAHLVADAVGFGGEIVFDDTKPDGTPRKLMDNGKIHAIGWQPTTGLREGIAIAYRHFLAGSGAGLGGGTLPAAG